MAPNPPSSIVNVALVDPTPSLTDTVTDSPLPDSPLTFDRSVDPLMLKFAAPDVIEYVSVWPVFGSVDASVPITPFSASGGVYVVADSVGTVGSTSAVQNTLRQHTSRANNRTHCQNSSTHLR